MITVTFYATNGRISRGVVIGRQEHMLEVAWDVGDSPANISWVNPTAQVGKMVLSAEEFRPVHSAIKDALDGNVDEARATLWAENKKRSEERNRNSR